MTNIVKQALNEKLQSIENQIDTLTDKRTDYIHTRVKELLHPAFEFLPDAAIKIGYDSFYIYPSLDMRNEILSINSRTYGTNYLNTYSTFIDSESEFKRLIFNGKVAELFLNDSELFGKLFAPTEFDEELNSLRNESWSLQKEIDKIEQQEIATLKHDKLTKLLNSEEIEFENPITLSYGAKKYDSIDRVISMKCLNFNKSKKKAIVQFTCKSWQHDGENYVSILDNIPVKYLEYYI